MFSELQVKVLSSKLSAKYVCTRCHSGLTLSSEGEYLSTHEDPVDSCEAMRQLQEAIPTRGGCGPSGSAIW